MWKHTNNIYHSNTYNDTYDQPSYIVNTISSKKNSEGKINVNFITLDNFNLQVRINVL